MAYLSVLEIYKSEKNLFYMKAVILVLCFWMSGVPMKAETSEKKYEKTFPKEGIEELVLSNNYGKMDIVQIGGEEIKVTVNMKVVAKSEMKADEILELIQIHETLTSQYLDLKTEFGKDMTLRQFLTNTTLNVDYKVFIPKGIRLRLISTNGNVYLTNFSGEINADIRSGDFKATSLSGGEFFIKQEKGIFNVESVATMKGEFRNCSVRIASGDDVCLTTNACDGELGSMGKLNLRASGGTVKIGDIEELTGSSSFTKFEIQDLGNIMDMDMKMGEMNVRNIQLLFSEIRLKGSFTKVGLTFAQDAGYHLEVKHNKSLKMDLARGMVLEEKSTAERNMTIGTKFVGNVKYSGKVFLNLSNGSLFIQ